MQDNTIFFLSIIILYTTQFLLTDAVVTCGPDDPTRWTIRDPVTGFTISAGARVAGAIDSIIHNSKEYINACDHGRELQLAVTTTHGECYNPTEAGSSEDSGGSKTSSSLLGINTINNTLRTTIAPAFWLAPGECEAGCGCAVNTQKVSKYIMDKQVSFNPFGVVNSFRYLADVHIPESVPRVQVESPTGYLNSDFNRFWTINPSSGAVTEVPSPGEGKGAGFADPVCLGTQDAVHVMCAFSAVGATQYVFYDFSHLAGNEGTTKWSIVKVWDNVIEGTVLGVVSYVCLGTIQDVQSCIPTLVRHAREEQEKNGVVL